MDWGVIGYPQVVLAVWGPLLLRAVWAVWVRFRAPRAAPSVRALVVTAVAIAPPLALFVPFEPSTPLRGVLPWRSPFAWGIANTPPDAVAHSVVGLVLTFFAVVPACSIVVSFVVGLLELASTRHRLAGLVVGRRGRIRLLADDCVVEACVAGMAFPAVHATRAVLDGPHAAAVLAHEEAHRRRFHPLLKWVVGCAVRSWWWIPGARALRQELLVSTELWADESARGAVGDRTVARALLASVAPGGPARQRPMAVAALVGPSEVMSRRVDALSVPVRRRSAAVRAGVPVVLVGALVAFVVLF